MKTAVGGKLHCTVAFPRRGMNIFGYGCSLRRTLVNVCHSVWHTGLKDHIWKKNSREYEINTYRKLFVLKISGVYFGSGIKPDNDILAKKYKSDKVLTRYQWMNR